ncbi:MAG: hypothetical protein IBX47_12170 [Desulfuromonadales bacterium]|nr:hypothetical protein [Desulfuromonadales bacterium]
MKKWLAAGVCGLFSFLIVIGTVGPVFATTVSGRASTVLEWFDTPDGETAVPAYQYLMLNARDIGGKGWNFSGYGRLSGDLADEVDADSRLYTAYFQKNYVPQKFRVKIGRQFVSTTAGGTILDGIDLNYSGFKAVKLRLLGGLNVVYDSDYEFDNYFFGAAISGSPLKNMELGLSYVQKWDEGDLAQELIGFDFDYDLAKIVHLYSETQYSLLYESITYFLAGASSSWSKDWRARLEYLYSMPVFDSTNIYSVFAVAEYQEIMGEVDYRINSKLRSYLRYTHEIYQEYSDAGVVDVGLESVGIEPLRWYVAGVYRNDDDGQNLYGVKGHVSYRFMPDVTAGFGANVDVLERRLGDDDETTSSRIWIDGAYDFSKTIQLQAKIERVESDLWDEYYRGRVRLNVLF